jgi:hypothetical protein
MAIKYEAQPPMRAFRFFEVFLRQLNKEKPINVFQEGSGLRIRIPTMILHAECPQKGREISNDIVTYRIRWQEEWF